MWLGGNLSELWSFAQNRAASSSHSNKTTRVRPNDGVTSAISLSKDGLYGKACRLRYCIHNCFYKSTLNYSECSASQIQVIGLCCLTCISEQSKRAVECWVN